MYVSLWVTPKVHHHNSWLIQCRRTADPSGGNAAVCTWASQAALCAMLRHSPKCSAVASQNIIARACPSLLVHQLQLEEKQHQSKHQVSSLFFHQMIPPESGVLTNFHSDSALLLSASQSSLAQEQIRKETEGSLVISLITLKWIQLKTFSIWVRYL